MLLLMIRILYLNSTKYTHNDRQSQPPTIIAIVCCSNQEKKRWHADSNTTYIDEGKWCAIQLVSSIHHWVTLDTVATSNSIRLVTAESTLEHDFPMARKILASMLDMVLHNFLVVMVLANMWGKMWRLESILVKR